MIFLCFHYEQDAYSYDIEQSRNDEVHNMLTSIMRAEDNLSLQDAMSLIHAHISALKERFLAIHEEVWSQQQQSSEPGDTLLTLLAYIEGIGNWVRANDAWSFESQRYFGPKGLEIQAARVVQLQPKRVKSTVPPHSAEI